MPSKKVKATIPGLASRAAMAAAKKRGTVSAAVTATSASTLPAGNLAEAVCGYIAVCNDMEGVGAFDLFLGRV